MGAWRSFTGSLDHRDRIGIVGGIFEPDNLGHAGIEQLVDIFSKQAIDFFGALRARIYDEQIRDFIHTVGVNQVSQRVVNSDQPLQFAKPNFTLPHLLEVGQHMVSEQQRLQEMRLADQYNRALRERAPHPAEQAIDSPSQPFYRTYEPSAYDAPPQENGQARSASVPAPERTSRPPEFSGKQLSPDAISHVRSLLTQGYRVGMEHVDRRRFRMNSWQSCSTVQTQEPEAAVAVLEQCLVNYPDEYVRLIGIDPKNKQRVLEHIIHRPTD